MPLHSMTGFARSEGGDAQTRWHWELRSVNGRGLDVRLRLPPGFEALDQPARGAINKRLTRGNLTASLAVQRDDQVSEIRINEQNLAQVVAAAKRISELTGNPDLPIEAIINARGVLEIREAEEDAAQSKVRQAAILQDLETALDDLVRARTAEGAQLTDTMRGHITEIARLAALAQDDPSRSPDAIQARLSENLKRLSSQTELQLDHDRLHQEAMLLATKADIAEELDRIAAHVTAARALLAQGSPVGRKLDFLVQEFNREANTVCSKANHIDITRIGLDLKAVIDQFREQVQNVE